MYQNICYHPVTGLFWRQHRITQDVKFEFKYESEKSQLFSFIFFFYNFMTGCSKKNSEKIIIENAFEQKENKPG